MEELKLLIKDFFSNDKKFHSLDELRKTLNIKGEKQTDIFYDALNELIEDGSLFFDAKKGYRIFTNDIGLAFGEIEINKAGTGFVHTNNGYTILIENNDLNGALDGDKVIVNSINMKRKDFFSGEIYKVIKRKKGEIIFEVIGNGKIASLIPHNIHENVNISINKNQLKDLVDGQLVLIKLGTEINDGAYLGEIVKIIGHKNDPDIDIQLIASKYNIPTEFSKEALEELNSIPTEVSDSDILDRTDLRDKNIVTIDCDDTKDRDDAVLVQKLQNGNFKLITSISAVNFYVKEGMKLYEEAIDRATSHYLNGSCIPQFPPKISNGICSLNPDVDRLTRTIEVEITPDGDIVDTNIYKSVIRSRKAMKYSEVNEVLKGNMIDGYQEFENDLKLMKELSDIYDKFRKERNCIDFDIPDIKVIKDENKETIGFKNDGNGNAERIIENLMLITNSAVALYYSWFPLIYRVHEAPDSDAVKSTIKLLRQSNLDIPKINNVDEKAIVSILNKTKTLEEAEIIKTNLLLSMKRARYDVNNIGHFALQLDKYCHFTSPIRRIADFMTHSLTDKIDEMDFSEENINAIEKQLKEVSEHASKMEKIAQDAEEEAKMMAMAEYMEKHIGEEFKARIIKLYKNGMFIKTENLITGKVKIDDILDDKYYFDSDRQAIIGKANKKKYQIGNKICVISKSADKSNRSIEFEIPNQKVLSKNK